jgi:hypothetical protein
VRVQSEHRIRSFFSRSFVPFFPFSYFLFLFFSAHTYFVADEDNCANHLCGELSTCIDLKCTYTCKCIPGTEFDPFSKSCVQTKRETDSFSDVFYALSPVLPLALFAFFSFVCAFSIRIELLKIRKGHQKNMGGFLSRFMHMNRRGLEGVFSPIFGPRNLKLK